MHAYIFHSAHLCLCATIADQWWARRGKKLENCMLNDNGFGETRFNRSLLFCPLQSGDAFCIHLHIVIRLWTELNANFYLAAQDQCEKLGDLPNILIFSRQVCVCVCGLCVRQTEHDPHTKKRSQKNLLRNCIDAACYAMHLIDNLHCVSCLFYHFIRSHWYYCDSFEGIWLDHSRSRTAPPLSTAKQKLDFWKMSGELEHFSYHFLYMKNRFESLLFIR